MRVPIVIAGLLLTAVSAAGALDVDLKAYNEARRRGEMVSVEGRVYTERRKPTADDEPIAHATVVMLPRSEALLRRLDDLRAHARDSPAAYRDAATKMRRAREMYERELWESGSPDLVVATVVDAGGRFALGDIPAGRWVVWVTHSRFVDSHPPKVAQRDRQRFILPPRLIGYYAERAWLRELEMAPGMVATVDLNDRNVWFAGVVEDRVLDAGSR
jgi:hypothetical protein